MKKCICLLVSCAVAFSVLYATVSDNATVTTGDSSTVVSDADDNSSGNNISEINVSENEKPSRPGESKAALVIVILLFIVLFAWPPIFKKISAKYDYEQ